MKRSSHRLIGAVTLAVASLSVSSGWAQDPWIENASSYGLVEDNRQTSLESELEGYGRSFEGQDTRAWVQSFRRQTTLQGTWKVSGMSNPFGGLSNAPPDPGVAGSHPYWVHVYGTIMVPPQRVWKLWGTTEFFEQERSGALAPPLGGRKDSTPNPFDSENNWYFKRMPESGYVALTTRSGPWMIAVIGRLTSGGEEALNRPRLRGTPPSQNHSFTPDYGGNMGEVEQTVRALAEAYVEKCATLTPPGGGGGIDLPSFEDSNWITSVGAGAGGAAGLAAAARILATRWRKQRKTKKGEGDDDEEDEEEDEDQVIGHILQLSVDRLDLKVGEPQDVDVRIFEVTPSGAYRPAKSGSTTLRVPGDWAGALSVTPSQGRSDLRAQFLLSEFPESGEASVAVTASTGTGSHAATIHLSAPLEPSLECDPEQVELVAGQRDTVSITAWVENAGPEDWEFTAEFEKRGDVPISMSLEETEKPFARYVVLTDATPAGAARPLQSQVAYRLIIKATPPEPVTAGAEARDPLERHLDVIVVWEGLFLGRVGHAGDDRWHVAADDKVGAKTTLEFHAVAVGADGRVEENPETLGLGNLEFGLGEAGTEKHRNLCEAAELNLSFDSFPPSNLPGVRYHATAGHAIPGDGKPVPIPYRAWLPGADEEKFSVAIPLCLDPLDTSPFSEAWQVELDRCRKMVDEFVPAGHRAKFHQLINDRKNVLGAEGLYELRRKIWSIAYEFILAEGAEGYQNEALWADRVVTLLEWTQWGADMAFGAVSGAALGPYAPFAQMVKTQLTSVLVAYAEGRTPESWLDVAINQVTGIIEGKIVDPDMIAKLGINNKALIWSIFCAYFFGKAVYYEKKTLKEAAWDTLREVRDEVLASWLGDRVRSKWGTTKTKGDDSETKPEDDGKTKKAVGDEEGKQKPVDEGKRKSDDETSRKTGESEGGRIKPGDESRVKPGEDTRSKDTEPAKPGEETINPKPESEKESTTSKPESGEEGAKTKPAETKNEDSKRAAEKTEAEKGEPKADADKKKAEAAEKKKAEKKKKAEERKKKEKEKEEAKKKKKEPTTEERNEAWKEARKVGKRKVKDFENAMKNGTPEQRKAAALEVQADKQALWEMNRKADDQTKQAMIDEMNKIYEDVDRRTKQELADRINAERRKRWEAAKKAGNHELANALRKVPDVQPHEIKVFNPTNKKTEIKVGADRDITMRYPPAPGEIVYVPHPDQPGRYVLGKVNPDGTASVRNTRGEIVRVKAADVDVPSRMLEEAYNKNFYEAVTGRKAGAGDGAAIRETADLYDQCCTDRLHPEAYGRFPWDLDTAIGEPGRGFTDPQQVGGAMAFKGQHWFRKAEVARDLGDHATAETNMAEGMRQMSKQWKNQVMRRRDAAAGPPINAKLSPVDSRLEKAVNIMDEVGKQKLTPADAEARLKKLGYSPDGVAEDVGKQVEALQKLQPQPKSNASTGAGISETGGRHRQVCPYCGARTFSPSLPCLMCGK